VKPSATIAVTDKPALKAREATSSALAPGPDFDTPPHQAGGDPRIEAGKDQVHRRGRIPELKEAIIGKFRRETVSPQAEQDIVGTAASRCSTNAMMATINPGDEVIFPSQPG